MMCPLPDNASLHPTGLSPLAFLFHLDKVTDAI